MENVTIVGVEDNALVLATESGERFALAIDEVLRREVRRTQERGTDNVPTVSPREIQRHIRAGLTSTEVAELLGVELSTVERFEGPVLAEREHIIGQALAVPVLMGSDVEPAAQPTFGTAIRGKLAELGAENERWASWKDEHGWTVKLEFTASEVDHDARWTFDPRSSNLTPINADASTLSRQGPLPDGLIPRLRALDSDRPSPYKDDAAFEASSFEAAEESLDDSFTAPSTRDEGSPAAVREAAMTRAPEPTSTPAETADLLAALRRRRGQRDTPPSEPDENEVVRDVDSDPIALFADLVEEAESKHEEESAPTALHPSVDSQSRKRNKRNSMPSWDEIVFGARSDD